MVLQHKLECSISYLHDYVNYPLLNVTRLTISPAGCAPGKVPVNCLTTNCHQPCSTRGLSLLFHKIKVIHSVHRCTSRKYFSEICCGHHWGIPRNHFLFLPQFHIIPPTDIWSSLPITFFSLLMCHFCDQILSIISLIVSVTSERLSSTQSRIGMMSLLVA